MKDFTEKHSLPYLDHIRGLPCMVSGQQAEPAHLKHVGQGADRKAPNVRHFTAIPLSRGYHRFLDEHPNDFMDRFGNPWRYAMQIFLKWSTGENFNK